MKKKIMNKLNEIANKLLDQWVITDKIYNSIKNLSLTKQDTLAVYTRLLKLDTRHIEVVTQTKIATLRILLSN